MRKLNYNGGKSNREEAKSERKAKDDLRYYEEEQVDYGGPTPVVLGQGGFQPLGDMWQREQTLLIVTKEGLLLISV